MDVYIYNFIKIKFTFTDNNIYTRYECEINPNQIPNRDNILHPYIHHIKYLLNHKSILWNNIISIMYGTDPNFKDDEEIFIITNSYFYGISLTNNTDICKYVIIRDSIRKDAIFNISSYILKDVWFTVINLLGTIQEVQYRIHDPVYEWNIYYVAKEAPIFNQESYKKIITIIKYLHNINIETTINTIQYDLEYLKFLEFYKYKISMLGFSKKYIEKTISFKIFLSKFNIN